MADGLALGSASHVVIGATDVDATVAFLGAFGFAVRSMESSGCTLDRGAGHRTDIVVVPAVPGRRLTGYDLGPRGLDLYTTDLDESVRIAAATGADVGPIGTVEIGPMVMRQVTVWGPDDIPVVLIENSSRRASLLDDHPGELHSEVHSLVWAVAERDAEVAWWTDRGVTKGMDLAFDAPAVAEFMRLPDPQVEVAMVMLANEANDPIRFELLEFTGRDGAPFPADGTAGIQAVGYTVVNPPVDPADAWITTPGGVVIHLRAG